MTWTSTRAVHSARGGGDLEPTKKIELHENGNIFEIGGRPAFEEIVLL